MGCVELGGVLVYGAKVMLPRWDLINLWGTYSTPTSDVWDGTIHINLIIDQEGEKDYNCDRWSMVNNGSLFNIWQALEMRSYLIAPFHSCWYFLPLCVFPTKKIERPRACRLCLVHLILNCRCCPWAQFVIWTGWTNIAGCFYLNSKEDVFLQTKIMINNYCTAPGGGVISFHCIVRYSAQPTLL